jgi:hypothetical protein
MGRLRLGDAEEQLGMVAESGVKYGNNESHPTIKLTVQSGGVLELEKIGVLPEFLMFYSAQVRRT